MPSALQSSTGEDILVKNVGSNTFTLKDYSGGTITTVTAGAAIYVYLKDVSTAAGQWSTVAFGVGSSSVNAASLVGYGIKAISASLNQSHPATIANVTFTIGASDRAQLYLTSVGVTINLPAAIGIGNDFFFLVRNVSTGNTTIDANGAELIDGAGTVVLAPEESCLVCCTGTTWYTVGRGRSTVFEYTQLTKNVAGNTDVTLTGSEASNSILKFIGALTGNINIIVPSVTAIWYVDNSTSGPYSLTIKTSAGSGVAVTIGNRVILYGDGVNVQSAQTVFATSGAFDTGSASVPSITFVSDTTTGAYNSGANEFGITVGGVQAANFAGSGLTLTNPLAATSGGTGFASYAIGDIVYASTTTALSKLADVATGNALISGGVATAPSWGKIGLTTHVSGILPAENGGTNNAFFGVSGPTTSVKTYTFPDATCSVLTSNDTVTVAQGGTGVSTIGAAETTLVSNGTALSFQYSRVAQNAQNGNITLALTDSSKHIYSKNAGAQTITVPTNASVAFPIGTAITIVNNGTTAITFTTTSLTVYKAGTSTAWASGSTLAVRGLVTLLKVETDTWFISGAGLS
jgi:hypothetical protein